MEARLELFRVLLFVEPKRKVTVVSPTLVWWKPAFVADWKDCMSPSWVGDTGGHIFQNWCNPPRRPWPEVITPCLFQMLFYLKETVKLQGSVQWCHSLETTLKSFESFTSWDGISVLEELQHHWSTKLAFHLSLDLDFCFTGVCRADRNLKELDLKAC